MLRITTLSFAPVALMAVFACSPRAKSPTSPAASPASSPADPTATADPNASQGGTEVTLCDGKTKAYVSAGEAPTREVGERIADTLMAQWMQEHPERDWESAERKAHTLQPAADNQHLVQENPDRTYGRFTQRDVDLWKRETERVALMGSRVFHSADELGSTVAVSCDMCHPHGANTHPETYPKFQTQLGRVVLLRDMINWCIQHPVRAEPLDADDPRMRALEAYIYAQRRGVTLEYGKH
jgi:thiosulfate dehydrogenase